ncbi:GspE/PulE family protein [Allocoleopsis sp.]|uniref:GspE/PulE family protein n=1 Tax=Allocoleopsis sp. TaxID=3088169 RepID=UPI002FD61C50
MSVPSYFSAVAKILIQSGYINVKQMQRVFAQFQGVGKSLAQGGFSLIEVLESITGQPLPEHLRQHLWNNLSCTSASFIEKLIRSGYVTHDQMQQALEEVRRSGQLLPEILKLITGRPFPAEFLHQAKQQQLFELKVLYGVKSCDLELIKNDYHQVREFIDRLISIDICRRYHLVPISKTKTQAPSLLVAMVDPNNLDAEDDINRILRPQGIALERMVITQEDYQNIIAKYLDEKLARQKQLEIEQAVDVQQDLENISSIDTLPNAPDEVEELDWNGAEDAPVINLVNKILAKALQEGVSDIHIEPQEDHLRIRFRKDGVMRQAFNLLPKKVIPAVSARFKIMAELDITERRLPQNGKIRRIYQGRKADFRVSTLPSRFGETIVLRILDYEETPISLDRLIINHETLHLVKKMAKRPFGLILVTGSTGSGKITTLYSILREQNDIGINICTVEDLIEYTLPGTTQVQARQEKGMDFASILLALMQQDPDVIMVSEIRDKETAKIALEASLTGHFMLAALHANDTTDAIARLSRIGVELYMIANGLIGVISQRLLRQICVKCRIPYHASVTELARFGWSTSGEGEGEVTLYKANTLQPEEIQEARSTGTLCQRCNGIGYKGRVAAYEVMCISEQLQTLINEGASTEQLRQAAVNEGMKTLLSYSLELVREGYTTLAEVERVVYTDSGLELELKAKRQSTLTPRSSPNTDVKNASTNPLLRLQQLEKQLEALTHQFQQLKQELGN